MSQLLNIFLKNNLHMLFLFAPVLI
jgi:hypothetical protein